MKEYLVIDDSCKCELKVLGTYDSYDEAVEAAIMLESCGINAAVIHKGENK